MSTRVAPAPFIGLSFSAGCVDAISFIGFGLVFTANMTGNTVLLGIALVAKTAKFPGNLGILPPLVAIAAFVAGAIVVLPAFRAGYTGRRAAQIVYGEVLLIAVAAAIFTRSGAPDVLLGCIVLVSFAMGAQSIVATKAGLPGISTTYVTGTLVTAVTRGFGSGVDPQRRREALHDAMAWFGYLAGAAIGTLLFVKTGHLALWGAAVFVLCCAVWVSRSER